MKKLGTIFSILLFIYACGKDDSPAVDNSPAATENVAPQIDATTFPAAETITDKDVIGTISATDPDGDDEKLVFSITANSNSLFNISDAGVLSLSEGKTLDASTPTHEITVSVTDGIDASNAKITIQVVDVTLSLDVEEIVLAKEDSAQAVATLMGITGTISWSSDNEDVASVDEEGNITALGSGNAIITASFENLSVTLTVTVNPDIYIVGSAQLNGDNGLRVVLWKNGEPTFLTDGTAFASGRDVFVSNGDVYAVGTERNNDNITVAKLWINGEPTDLSDGTISSYANSIFIENGNIYIAGDSFNNSWIPWVWFNGQFTNLSNGQTSNFAESIYVENGVTYVAGLENPGNNIEIAKQWVDFNPTNLTNGENEALVNSIFVNESTVYTVGSDRINKDAVILWINGTPTYVTDGTTFGEAKDVYVVDGIPYVSYTESINGSDRHLRIWKNGEITTLSTNGPEGKAPIFVKNGNIYIADVEYDTENEVAIPTLWINGQGSTINLGETDNIYINSIFVD